MSGQIRISKYILAGGIFLLFAFSACATKKKSIAAVKKKEALCDLSHLGKNNYFYSHSYQRKIKLRAKKIARH